MKDIIKKSTTEIITDSISSLSNLKKQKEYKGVLDKDCVLLLDLSGSMFDMLNTGKRKIELLKEALQQFKNLKIVGFNSVPFEVNNTNYLQPAGGTNLALALASLKQYKQSTVILISDGLPDNPDAAIVEARSLDKIIHTIYIGEDGDYGQQFLIELSKTNKGTSATVNVHNLKSKLIEQAVKDVLSIEDHRENKVIEL